MRNIKTYYHLLLVAVILLPLYLLITCTWWCGNIVVCLLVNDFQTKTNLYLRWRFNTYNPTLGAGINVSNNLSYYFVKVTTCYIDESKNKVTYLTLWHVRSYIKRHCRRNNSWNDLTTKNRVYCKNYNTSKTLYIIWDLLWRSSLGATLHFQLLIKSSVLKPDADGETQL